MPEVWRIATDRVGVLVLVGEEYVEVERRAALPILTSDALGRFLDGGRTLPRTARPRELRRWVRG